MFCCATFDWSAFGCYSSHYKKTVCWYNHDILIYVLQHEIQKLIKKVSQMFEDVKARYEQCFLVLILS